MAPANPTDHDRPDDQNAPNDEPFIQAVIHDDGSATLVEMHGFDANPDGWLTTDRLENVEDWQ